MTGDRDELNGEFAQRLDELEALTHEITSRLEPDVPAPPFTLVVVCTGNRVRSVVAAGFLRMLVAGLPVRVDSFGTLDLGPVPPLPEAIETAAAHGLDISAHRARCVTAEDLSDADLVIGFERRHVAAAVVDAGARRERTFTLVELTDLLAGADAPASQDPVERARELVARAHALRPGGGIDPAEIADPLGGTADVYRTTILRVRGLCERLAVTLFGDCVTRLPALAGDVRRARRRLSVLRLARGDT